ELGGDRGPDEGAEPSVATVHGDLRLRGDPEASDADGAGPRAVGEGGGHPGRPGDGRGDHHRRGEGDRDLPGDVRRGEAGASRVPPLVTRVREATRVPEAAPGWCCGGCAAPVAW